MKNKQHLFLLLVLVTSSLSAQNKSDDQAFLTGTVGVEGIGNYSTAKEDLLPLTFNSYGNFNLNIFKFKMPFYYNIMENMKFNLADRDKSQIPSPTVTYGMTPTLEGKKRSLKLHLGYSSMNFSPYTYSGMQFLGAGFEYQGRGIRLSAFKGRFNRESYFMLWDHRSALQRYTDDLLGFNPYEVNSPQFRREVLAGKLGFGTKKSYFDLMFMRASDDKTSLPDTIYFKSDALLRDSVYKAKENLTIGASTRIQVDNWLILSGNIAMSLYTPDQNAPLINISNFGGGAIVEKAQGIIDKVDEFFTLRSNMIARSAGDASVATNFKHFKNNITYRYIEADYTSLGVKNLLQNIRSLGDNGSLNMFTNHSNLTYALYLQRDNLNNKQEFTNQVGTYNVNWSNRIGEHFTLNLLYNGIKQDRLDGSSPVTDSCRIDQITHNFTGTPAVTWKHEDLTHTINANINWVEARNLNPDLDTLLLIGDAYTITTGLGYQINLMKKGIIINTTFDYAMSGSSYSVYDAYTLGAGISYRLYQGRFVTWKCNYRGSLGYNVVKEQGDVNQISQAVANQSFYNRDLYTIESMKEWSYNNTLSLNFTTKTGHMAALRATLSNLSNREIIAQKVTTSAALRVTATYAYSFGHKFAERKTDKKDDSKPKLEKQEKQEKPAKGNL